MAWYRIIDLIDFHYHVNTQFIYISFLTSSDESKVDTVLGQVSQQPI